jgi:hypothetical protein
MMETVPSWTKPTLIQLPGGVSLDVEALRVEEDVPRPSVLQRQMDRRGGGGSLDIPDDVELIVTRVAALPPLDMPDHQLT